MIKNKTFVMLVIASIVLSACFAPIPPEDQGPQNQPVVDVDTPTSTQEASQSTPTQAAPTEDLDHSDTEHHSDVDLTHLELGNGKASTSPQVGYVYSCMQFNNVGDSANGSWFNGDGTWDATRKLTVDGSVTWPGSFTISIQGDQRVFTSNDLPDHPTGIYPISPSDDAYQFDRNPGSISAQSITLSFPANPVLAAQPNCVGGEIGIMLSGVVIFNAFDADGRDAPANEIQDDCDGHPQNTGIYHYHSLSDCLEDTTGGHSAIMGYAFDGYGIYGYYGEDGAELTNEDLDECHGHTHAIEWDGQTVEMYHYHATHQFPYVVGCFHGTSSQRGPIGGDGGQQGQDQAGGTQPQGGQGNGQQPPQEAIDACAGLSQNATCSVGPMSGTCQMPPGMTQLVCVPQGGPPPGP